MKKTILTTVVLSVLLAAPAFAEWRIDAGVDVPWGVGNAISTLGGSSTSGVNILESGVFPVPEGNFLYQAPVGPVKLGIGIRAFSLIVESAAWPNAMAEVNLGPVAIDLQVGGGVFLFFGLFSDLTTGAVVIPDLSAYFKLGKIFRLGGGGMLFYDPNLSSSGVPYVIYLAGKLSFTF